MGSSQNKHLADNFVGRLGLDGLMGVILVWPHAGPAGYIPDNPLPRSGNTFWHPEQCLQQTSIISPSGGTGIDPVIPTVAVLLPSQYC